MRQRGESNYIKIEYHKEFSVHFIKCLRKSFLIGQDYNANLFQEWNSRANNIAEV